MTSDPATNDNLRGAALMMLSMALFTMNDVFMKSLAGEVPLYQILFIRNGVVTLAFLALAYRRYSMDYDLDEKSAHVARRGLHAAQVQAPSDFRAAKRSAATPQPLPEGSDCRIKGNISSKGVRIYHVPGQENYNATRISPSKGERWFCSEAAARAAGWRRAKR
jgi:hypothetical protein